jgi:hypothetical protein
VAIFSSTVGESFFIRRIQLVLATLTEACPALPRPLVGRLSVPRSCAEASRPLGMACAQTNASKFQNFQMRPRAYLKRFSCTHTWIERNVIEAQATDGWREWRGEHLLQRTDSCWFGAPPSPTRTVAETYREVGTRHFSQDTKKYKSMGMHPLPYLQCA